MNSKAVDFLLSPDAAAARRIRVQLAQMAPGLYRLAGTWTELMAQVESAYLLPAETDDWTSRLMQAASAQRGAFWEASLAVAPRETLAELDAALQRLLAAAGPDADGQALLARMPSETRLYRRLADLFKLLEAVGRRPAPMKSMERLLDSRDQPLRAIRVYRDAGRMDLDPWQSAVLERLEKDAPTPDAGLQALLEAALTPPATTAEGLQAVRNLYRKGGQPPGKAAGVRVLAARDSLAEAETAAGLIQQALKDGSRPADIGLLLPDDKTVMVAVETVFEGCGLPLSGFNRPVGKRDLGRETVRQFLLCLRKPAPVMAVAALLTSPLLPWPAQAGHAMALAVMQGDFFLKSTSVTESAGKLMDILDQGAATPADLQGQLTRFVSLLPANGALDEHVQRARDAAAWLQAALAGMPALDWERLLYLTAPEALSATAPADFWQAGVPVFHEGAWPWCSVRHLFVLGFNQGHYPGDTGTSAVFTEAEWDRLEAAGWPIETGDRLRKRRRDLFAVQLAAATETVTVLFSRRDAGGQPLEPSASLVFLARSLGLAPDDLVLDLDRSQDLQQIVDLPLVEAAAPSPPRPIRIADIRLGADLLETFGSGTGRRAPLSPSAAETLMVSPFAWLLGRLDCEPREWGGDQFDPMTAGTLAHRVFEALFQAGRPLPDEKTITQQVPKLMGEWVLQIAPYLRSPDWRVERYKFETEVLKAAVRWKQLLASCGAGVVAAEQWLRGQYGAVPLHGQSDLLLQLPSGRLLVVDYKKSSSGKRRERMRSGFDLQAHLYRVMIQSGGLPGYGSPPADIGIVYYLINDTIALADSPVEADGSVPGWEVLDNDISSNAMDRLDRCLEQISRGIVRLNTDGDEDWWSKNAGIILYALDNSPLLRLFMHTREVSA